MSYIVQEISTSIVKGMYMKTEHPIIWDDVTVSRLWNYYSKTPPYSEIYFSKVFGDRMLKKLDIPFDKEISVLDFGCGPGDIWEHMQQLSVAWNYTGLDFSSDTIEKLRKKALGTQKFSGAIHADKLPTDLTNNQFDLVLLFEVVEHLTDDILDNTLNEIHRILKPGGRVAITTPNNEDLSKATKFCPDCGAIFHEWQHIRSWNKSTLQDYMHSRGFTSEFLTPLDFSEHGLRGNFIAKTRRIITGNYALPHLVAVFKKSK